MLSYEEREEQDGDDAEERAMLVRMRRSERWRRVGIAERARNHLLPRAGFPGGRPGLHGLFTDWEIPPGVALGVGSGILPGWGSGI